MEAGVLAPVGFFDPLGLSKDKDEDTLRMYREAEIKHGRVCMLATAGILTQELIKTGPVSGPGITHWDQSLTATPGFGAFFILI